MGFSTLKIECSAASAEYAVFPPSPASPENWNDLNRILLAAISWTSAQRPRILANRTITSLHSVVKKNPRICSWGGWRDTETRAQCRRKRILGGPGRGMFQPRERSCTDPPLSGRPLPRQCRLRYRREWRHGWRRSIYIVQKERKRAHCVATLWRSETGSDGREEAPVWFARLRLTR